MLSTERTEIPTKEGERREQDSVPGSRNVPAILLQPLVLRGSGLVCLFLKGTLGHPYLQKTSLSKLNLPVSKRQGWALQ